MARIERSAGFVIYRTRETHHDTNSSGGVGTPGEREYLLLDYGRHWDFAKGHVEKGEDDLATARRELAEETGITDARVIPGFQHEITYFFRDRRHGLIRKTVTFFLGEVSSSNVRISKEHVGYAFLPYDAALRRLTFPTAREILRLAQENVCPPETQPDDTLSQSGANARPDA